jgi:dipeptidyl aminopeptidase/acylaminoacyl peptidase
MLEVLVPPECGPTTASNGLPNAAIFNHTLPAKILVNVPHLAGPATAYAGGISPLSRIPSYQVMKIIFQTATVIFFAFLCIGCSSNDVVRIDNVTSVTPSVVVTSIPTQLPPSISPTQNLSSLGIGGQLVFALSKDTNGDNTADDSQLYKLELGTGTLRQLTFHPDRATEPSWSPDGKKIVFSSGDKNNFDLYVINADGSGLKQLTHTSENERMPTWSPDGKQIAYERWEGKSLLDKHIYTINSDGSGTRLLIRVSDDDTNPQWSPDGHFLAIESAGKTETERGIYLIDMETEVIYPLTPPFSTGEPFYDDLRWIPRDGGYFISLTKYTSEVTECELCVYKIRWQDNRPILEKAIFDLSGATFSIHSPLWGPNGEWLIFAYQPPERQQRFNLMFFPLEKNIFTASYQSLYLSQANGELIIANDFYNNYPDWIQ